MNTKQPIFRALALLAILTPMLWGCVDVESGYLSRLEISAEVETVTANGVTAVRLNTFGNKNTNVSSQVVYTVNGNEVDRDFSTFTVGANEIVATYTNPDNSIVQSDAFVIVGEKVELTIEVNRMSIPASGFDPISVVAKDQNGEELSEGVSIFVDDAVIATNEFTTTTTGDHTIRAEFAHTGETVSSNTITINATVAQLDPEPNNSARRVIIEEFTGTWCGWCPQAAYNIELLIEEYPEIITVAMHSGDNMENSFTGYMADNLNDHGYPHAMYDRINDDWYAINGANIWGESEILNLIEGQLEKDPLVDLGIETAINGNQATVDVSAYFHTGMTDQLYLSVYVVEDSLRASQENYYSGNAGFPDSPYYGLAGTISGFVHNHVHQASLTGNSGLEISQDVVLGKTLHEFDQISFNLSGYDPEQVKIVALVHRGTLAEDRAVLNSNQVKLGYTHDLY